MLFLGVEGVVDEVERGADGCGGGRRTGGAEREADEGRRYSGERARWRDPLLPLEGWGPCVRRRRGGGAAPAGAWDLRRGLFLRVPQELRRVIRELPGL